MMPLRRFTPVEVHTGRRRLELATFLTVFLSAGMFALAEDSAVFFLIVCVPIALHVWAAARELEIHAHRTVLNGGVLAASGVLLLRYLARDEDLVVALGHYVMVIQLCKLFERKRDRDYVQMMVMSLLLVLAGAMICQELLFAVIGLGYLVALSYAAMSLTVRHSLAAAALQQAPDAAGAAARSGWPKRAVLSRLTVVVAAMLATAVMVFLLSPRGAGGTAPPLRRARGEGVSGFANTVRLGEPRRIYLSDRVVMHVRLLSPDGVDLGRGGPLYLRGRVFNQYVDSRWAVPPRRRQYFPFRAPRAILARAVRQEVSMMPSLLPVVFATHPAVDVSSPDAAVRAFDNLEYDLKPSLRLGRPVRYTAVVLVGELATEELGHLRSVTGRPRYPDHAGMEVSPRVESLARRWCADLLAQRLGRSDARAGEQDLAIARRIADRLKERCTYTLDLTEVDPDRDAVEDFLFHVRRGHCEYFASALTVMCQALDVRARLATGFCATDYDDGARHYVVRQRDAHAWTEVYTEETDWAAVDATPAERFAPPPRTALGRWWTAARDLWRTWEFTWYAEVIGYDDDARRELAAWARSCLLSAWRAVRRAAAAVLRGLVELFARGRISEAVVWFFGCLAAASASLAAVLVLLKRRRPAPPSRAPAPAPKPPAFLAQLLELLRRHGLRARPSQTPRELASEAIERLGLPAETLHGLVALYYRIRWARSEAPPEELHAAEGQVRRLGEILSA
jgi:transglutaminase-like putative cysteine protease